MVFPPPARSSNKLCPLSPQPHFLSVRAPPGARRVGMVAHGPSWDLHKDRALGGQYPVSRGGSHQARAPPRALAMGSSDHAAGRVSPTNRTPAVAPRVHFPFLCPLGRSSPKVWQALVDERSQRSSFVAHPGRAISLDRVIGPPPGPSFVFSYTRSWV